MSARFMDLNSAYDIYRVRQVGALSASRWRETRAACISVLGRLRREQVEWLLSCGYDAGFRAEILAHYDLKPPTAETKTRNAQSRVQGQRTT